MSDEIIENHIYETCISNNIELFRSFVENNVITDSTYFTVETDTYDNDNDNDNYYTTYLKCFELLLNEKKYDFYQILYEKYYFDKDTLLFDDTNFTEWYIRYKQDTFNILIQTLPFPTAGNHTALHSMISDYSHCSK